MNKYDLLEAMNGIRDEYIKEAAAPPGLEAGKEEMAAFGTAAADAAVTHTSTGTDETAAARHKKRARILRMQRWSATVAALLCLSILVPNLLPGVSSTFRSVPLLGEYVRMVTFREYHGGESSSAEEVNSAEEDFSAEKESAKDEITTAGEKFSVEEESAKDEVTAAGEEFSESEEAEASAKGEFAAAGEELSESEEAEASAKDEVTAAGEELSESEEAEESAKGEFAAAGEVFSAAEESGSEDSFAAAESGSEPENARNQADSDSGSVPASGALGIQEYATQNDGGSGLEDRSPDMERETGGTGEEPGTAAPFAAAAVWSAAVNTQVPESLLTVAAQDVSVYESGVAKETGFSSLRFVHEVVTDSSNWFSLRINAVTDPSDGFEETVHFNYDIGTGKNASLSDLFPKGAEYVTLISDNIRTQMRTQMEADPEVEYWIDTTEEGAQPFEKIRPDQDYYIDQDGMLVICFDEMEAAPLYMGPLEFRIPEEVTSEAGM